MERTETPDEIRLRIYRNNSAIYHWACSLCGKECTIDIPFAIGTQDHGLVCDDCADKYKPDLLFLLSVFYENADNISRFMEAESNDWIQREPEPRQPAYGTID